MLDAVTLADPSVATHDLLEEMMWVKREYAAEVFTIARRRAFEMTTPPALDDQTAGAQLDQRYISSAPSRYFRPIPELAHDENLWAIAFLSDHIVDDAGSAWPIRAWRHTARDDTPIVFIRNGPLTTDEERQIEDVNRNDGRVFEIIDPRTTGLAFELPGIIARAFKWRH
ncbi:hypothetical protein ACH0AH_00710 [Microbacterium paludicola]|uniref:hypothetical protein n=1 Tax=Microbacterium paludicola TaxID=300019 RepID=UPI00387A566B